MTTTLSFFGLPVFFSFPEMNNEKKKVYAILACTHVVIVNFFIFDILFFTTKLSTWQVKWLNVSVFVMAMTRENAIDQPHLGFTQPIINVFAYFVFFRSINQALKMRKLPFHHKHAKSNTSRTKKHAQFLYILTKFHVILIVYLFIFYCIYHLRKKTKQKQIMGMNSPGIWCDGLVVTLVWFF